MKRLENLIITGLICAVLVLVVNYALGCASGRSSVPAYAEMFNAPDGSQCYAIISNGVAVGGNCK